jgi:hypothetical protein
VTLLSRIIVVVAVVIAYIIYSCFFVSKKKRRRRKKDPANGKNTSNATSSQDLSISTHLLIGMGSLRKSHVVDTTHHLGPVRCAYLLLVNRFGDGIGDIEQ